MGKKVDLNDLAKGSFHPDNLRRVEKELNEINNPEDDGIVLIPGDPPRICHRKDIKELKTLI